MSNIDIINNINILEVLNKLGYYEGINYKLQGNNIKMKQNGVLTDGWIGQVVGADGNGFLKCASGIKPGRFEGDNLNIVVGALGTNKAQAIKWFEDNFSHVLTKNTNGNLARKDSDSLVRGVNEEWGKLNRLDSTQIEYLSKRNIVANDRILNITRDFNGTIGLRVFSEGMTPMSIQGRNPRSKTMKDRFRLLSGHPAKGIFIDFDTIDFSKPIFLVEGMTDFLTIYQFTSQVIGLVSKDNGIKEVKTLIKSNNLEIIFIPDNDSAGDDTVEELKDIDKGVFNISTYCSDDKELKDVNDFLEFSIENGMSGEDMLETIFQEGKPLSNIQLALKKALRNRDNVGWKTGNKLFDKIVGGIVPGTTFLINGPSGQGKTTWAMWIMKCLVRSGKKVAFFSLETDAGKMLAQFLGHTYGMHWKKEVYPNIEKYLSKYGEENLKNLYLFDDIRDLDSMDNIAGKLDLDVIFIDYVQIVDKLEGTSSREKMGYLAKRLQEIARKNYICTIGLSQVTKAESKDVPVVYRSPKEAGDLQNASDTMINVGIYQGQFKVGFVKLKEGDEDYWGEELDTGLDKEKGDILIYDKFENIETKNHNNRI